jgi:hypothetical protein
VWLGAVVALGCGGEESSGGGGSSPTDTPASPSGSENAAAGPLVEDTTFELRASPSGPYTAGQQGTFEIRLVPRGDYHVNVDPLFPFAIALSGPGAVQFPEASLDREDAAEFTEQRARFAVPFTAREAGQHRVTATVDFAVCTPSTCLPEQRTLALVLPVQ